MRFSLVVMISVILLGSVACSTPQTSMGQAQASAILFLDSIGEPTTGLEFHGKLHERSQTWELSAGKDLQAFYRLSVSVQSGEVIGLTNYLAMNDPNGPTRNVPSPLLALEDGKKLVEALMRRMKISYSYQVTTAKGFDDATGPTAVYEVQRIAKGYPMFYAGADVEIHRRTKKIKTMRQRWSYGAKAAIGPSKPTISISQAQAIFEKQFKFRPKANDLGLGWGLSSDRRQFRLVYELRNQQISYKWLDAITGRFVKNVDWASTLR